MVPVRKIAAVLFTVALFCTALYGCSNSSLDSAEPVISDLNITPNPGREGSLVTVTVKYFSPVESPVTGLWSTLFAAGPNPGWAESRILVNDECRDCTVTGQFVLRKVRGTERVTVYAQDAGGRKSNGLSTDYTVLSPR